MIIVHRLNGTEFVLNERHIETIEQTPDTIITLTNDRKYLVKESVEEILERVAAYRRRIAVVPPGDTPANGG